MTSATVPEQSSVGDPERVPSKVPSATEPRPLRVLLVTARYAPFVGGTETHAREIAIRMAAAGHAVTVLTTNPGGRLPAEESQNGVAIRRVRAWPANRDYYLAPGIYRIVMGGGWDIVHAEGYHTLVAPLAMAAAWRSKVPYVVMFHSGGNSSRLRLALRTAQRLALRPLLARAGRLVAVSRWEERFFRSKLQLPAERFAMVYNGAPNLRELVVARDGDSRPEGKVLVSMGRLERYKGHHRVIAALPRVVERYPDVRLRILGSGPYEGTLRALAERMGVADRVEIAGVAFDDRRGLASTLAGATLTLALSDYEAYPIAVLEALSLGRPVLVSDTTGLSEFADFPLVTAIPPRSTTAEIAEAIAGQLERPAGPIDVVVDPPTWDECTAKILALYHEVLREAGCGS